MRLSQAGWPIIVSHLSLLFCYGAPGGGLGALFSALAARWLRSSSRVPFVILHPVRHPERSEGSSAKQAARFFAEFTLSGAKGSERRRRGRDQICRRSRSATADNESLNSMPERSLRIMSRKPAVATHCRTFTRTRRRASRRSPRPTTSVVHCVATVALSSNNAQRPTPCHTKSCDLCREKRVRRHKSSDGTRAAIVSRAPPAYSSSVRRLAKTL